MSDRSIAKNDNVLDNSVVERQNILNNKFAVDEIQNSMDVRGFYFDGQYYITTQHVADYFEVDIRTIWRYTDKYADELKQSGYEVVSGEKLRELKAHPDISVRMSDSARTARQGLFSFRAFLNIAMLLTESQKARELRQRMLNIAVDTVNKLAGGDTKYINQRDEKFLISTYYNEGYNKKLRSALRNYVTDRNDRAKYANYNDKVYNTIFKENARGYKNLLELKKQDKARDAMYAEVLDAISSFENAAAVGIVQKSKKFKRTLTRDETDLVFEETRKNPALEPQIERARSYMASLDNGLRHKRHETIGEYVSPINQADFERFLGEKSKALSERIDDNLEMFKRLKDK